MVQLLANGRPWLRLAVAGALTAGLVLSAGHSSNYAATSQRGRLVKVEPLPDYSGEICLIPAAVQRAERAAALAQDPERRRRTRPLPLDENTNIYANPPDRMIRDEYPSFAAVAVDPVRDEVVFTDESLFQILAYDRLENTPKDAKFSKPKRVIAGDNALIEFQSGLYIDPENGDLFAPNNDTVDTLVVFTREANGDAKPKRALHTPHGTFNVAVDEQRKEMYLTTQHDATVVVFRKAADKDEAPIRLLQGPDTELADPHGIAIDPKEEVFFVANYGSRALRDPERTELRSGVPGFGKGRDKPNWPYGREYAIPGSGTHSDPSITVYPLGAKGNDRPIRKIQGDKTQLNWPTGIAFHPTRRELFVANDMGPSILVFDANANGNVAPKRVLKGPNTKLANPTSVALDMKNGELWVANFGGHTGTVYPIDAAGDVAPLRTIRNAPEGTPSLMIGNPGALTYDSTREQILVPN